MKLKILDHIKVTEFNLIHHKAKVIVDKDIKTMSDLDELVNEVSIKVGYHPLGYGVYGDKDFGKVGEKTYVVSWRTGTHCD